MVQPTPKDIEKGKACAALAYILVGIIWYFADDKMRKNPYARFHIKQGIVLLIAWVIYSVVLRVLLFNAFFWGLWGIYSILGLVPWIFVIIGIINAVNGTEKELPVIGQFAKGLRF